MFTPEQEKKIRARIKPPSKETRQQLVDRLWRDAGTGPLTLEDQVERARNLNRNMVDITGAAHVDVCMSKDRSTLWVNVDGVCVLRVCRITKMDLTRG